MFYYNTNLEFKGAIILSTLEASKFLTKESREYKTSMWLRNPGHHDKFACYVDFFGTVSYSGGSIYDADGIRPALQICNLGSFNVGDIFSIGEYYFKIISPELAWLYKQDIGFDIFDKESNNYETSHVKRVVDAWFEELKKEIK